MIKKWKTVIIIILSLFLISPIYAEEGRLEVDISFPDFEPVNISGKVVANLIGLRPVEYDGCIKVTSIGGASDLTNKNLGVIFSYLDQTKEEPIMNLDRSLRYNSSYMIYDLSEKIGNILQKDNSGCIYFQASFLKTGTYSVQWELIGDKREDTVKMKYFSIVDPVTYENLRQQRELTSAEKNVAQAQVEASDSLDVTAKETRKLAKFTALLATFTALTAFVASLSILTYIQRFRPVVAFKFDYPDPNNPYALRIWLINQKPMKTKVRLNMNFRVNGDNIQIRDGIYNGEDKWLLNPLDQQPGYRDFFSDIKNHINDNEFTLQHLEDPDISITLISEVHFNSEFGPKDKIRLKGSNYKILWRYDYIHQRWFKEPREPDETDRLFFNWL